MRSPHKRRRVADEWDEEAGADAETGPMTPEISLTEIDAPGIEPDQPSAAGRQAGAQEAAGGAAAAAAADVEGEEEETFTDPYDQQTVEYARGANQKSISVESGVPSTLGDEPCMIGIDEAGRGPVLGPMVYGIAYCPVKNLKKLKSLGFADSKTLNEEQREKYFKIIKKNEAFLGWIARVLSPTEISHGMLGKVNYNLNALSHDTAINLIKRVVELGVNVTEVYVDTVGKAEHYQAKLQRIFPKMKCVVESKADSKFAIVSAASICAKVTRDRSIAHWRYPESDTISRRTGSGYPGDPDTKKWLTTEVDPVFGYPGFVRFAWQTTKTKLEDKAKFVEWEDDGDDDGPTSFGGMDMTTFFEKKNTRHRFFENRKLRSVKMW